MGTVVLVGAFRCRAGVDVVVAVIVGRCARQEWARVLLCCRRPIGEICLRAAGAGSSGDRDGGAGSPASIKLKFRAELFVHTVPSDKEADCEAGNGCSSDGPKNAAETGKV